MKKYIHYGATRYDPGKFRPIQNVWFFTKPYGGLWGSPVDAEYGWKEWNEEEHFRECREDNSFTFTLAPTARVLRISKRKDLAGLPRNESDMKESPYLPVCLDFEQLMRNGWDAVELENSRRLYWALYGWDCDSILVMNPDVVVPEGG